MTTKTVKLREILEVQNGFAFKTEFFNETDGLPLIRIRDLGTDSTKTHYSGEYRDEFIVASGDYLIGMDGNFRCRRWAGPKALLNQRVCRLRNFVPEVLPEYLFFGIQPKLDAIEASTAFATVKHISAKQILDIEFPLPTLPEQHRIVDLLSRADGIVQLRREAEKKAAELIPALFLDMFGNPATNPKGWPVENLGDHVAIPSSVRTPDLVMDADHPCIGADSIESHTGKLIGLSLVRDVQPKSGKYWFDTGDVLYSKIRPYLAKACLAPGEGYCSADMYPLRCKPSLHPEFLLGLLLSTAFTDYATAESVRAQMPKLNRETLFAYRVPVPSLNLQQLFAEQAAAVRSIQTQQFTATAKAKANFHALLSLNF